MKEVWQIDSESLREKKKTVILKNLYICILSLLIIIDKLKKKIENNLIKINYFVERHLFTI